jgi:predicted DNA-binding protein with PD1-like motif
VKTYPSDTGQAAFVRLAPGEDLLATLTAAARDLGIRAGTLQVIGAVSHLVLGYYDQGAREYRTHTFEGGYEIASGLGNVSQKDGEAFVHLHVVASGEDGAAVGGHVMDGTVVFLAEAYFRSLDGEAPVRTYEEDTGLSVWQ